MKYLQFLAIFGIVLLAGCNAHNTAKTAEANIFNELHRGLQVFCLLPDTIREQEIQELSRDIWQRGYGEDGQEAYVMWIFCPDTVEIDWENDIFEDTPPVSLEFLKDTSWKPGDCPTKWSDYGCPKAALEERKQERREREAAEKEAKRLKAEAQAEADRITADAFMEEAGNESN